MYASYEVQLLVLVFLLYAYDCALLLYVTECVVVLRGNEWVALRGSESFMLLGRCPYVMSLVRPDLPIFRGELGRPVEAGAKTLWSNLEFSLARVRLCSLVAGVGMFIMLPIALLGSGGHLLLVGAALAVYGSVVVAFWEIHSRRDALALTSSELRTMAIECLACPPFAVNLLRRITLRMDVGGGVSGARDAASTEFPGIESDMHDSGARRANLDDAEAHP